MIPLVAPTLFKSFPEFLKPIIDSGILLATVAAVALNAFFNKVASAEDAKAAAMATAHASEAA
jgi:NCS2 family nucleobase:cation symporter-2